MKSTQVATQWKELIIGQDHAIDKIVPYINRRLAGMNALQRTIGNFLLLGPTGTGKSHSVETLAEVLHGDEKHILRIDCGEYQLEHEVAKLLGSPPGYLGHKETQPMLSQIRVNSVASDKNDISIILFDEIEKANPSIGRVLLGILDKATCRLGDNTSVNFENCLIFMSSNLGAKEIAATNDITLGFTRSTSDGSHEHLQRIGVHALSKHFQPEFANRIDESITYKSHDADTLKIIAALELRKAEFQIRSRLGLNMFHLVYGADIVDFIAEKGTSVKYGARELKRTLARLLLNPLADDFVDEIITPGCRVYCRIDPATDTIVWDVEQSAFVIRPDGSVLMKDEEDDSLLTPGVLTTGRY